MELFSSKTTSAKAQIITYLLLLFVLSILTACSNTTVHLYTRYLSADQTTEIQQKLAEQGIKVETNELAIPQSIKQSSLIYSPLLDNNAQVEKISELLASLGFPISDTSPLVVDNHWYAKKSIGVMIVPEGINPHNRSTVADLANLYQGENCDENISIRLYANNRYQMNTDQPSENFDEFKEGLWRITSYPYVELRTEDRIWWFYFEVSQKAEVDVVGKVEKTILTPVERYIHFPFCNYTFGIR